MRLIPVHLQHSDLGSAPRLVLGRVEGDAAGPVHGGRRQGRAGQPRRHRLLQHRLLLLGKASCVNRTGSGTGSIAPCQMHFRTVTRCSQVFDITIGYINDSMSCSKH